MPPRGSVDAEPDVPIEAGDADRPELPSDNEFGPEEEDPEVFAQPPDDLQPEDDSDEEEDGEESGEEGAASAPEDDQFPVDAIRGERRHGGKLEYLLKWTGYEEAENTWQPAADVEDSLIEAWVAQKSAAAASGAAGPAAAGGAAAAQAAAAEADDEDNDDDDTCTVLCTSAPRSAPACPSY